METNPVPKIVIDADCRLEGAALFWIYPEDTRGIEYDTNEEALPMCDLPAVTTLRMLPRAPCPAWHLSEVSDSHPVASHAVCPILDFDDTTNRPKLAPCTVMLAKPVPPALVLPNVLSDAASVVKVFVTVDLNLPIVNCTLASMIAVAGPLHRSDESDDHTVISQEVPPSANLLEYSIVPKFTPKTVRLTDPVAGLLLNTNLRLWD